MINIWFQLSNDGNSQMIWRDTPYEAIQRFHEVLDGEGISYSPGRTKAIEVKDKFGATTMPGGIPLRFKTIQEVEQYHEGDIGRSRRYVD